MLQKVRERLGREEGFTLVELLVVMLILGILAAIAIPSFFNQRDKARDADAKALARTAQTAMETYATDNGGSYVGADAADLIAIEQTLNQADGGDGSGNGDALTVPSALATSYTVQVASANSPNVFRISRNASGVVNLECDNDNNDGCPSDGTWD